MKKNYLLTIIVCLFALGTTAQPVITYGGNAPQTGDSYSFSGASGTFDPGPAGANQSWDFSSINPTMFSTETAVNPGTTPFAPNFPESTIAFHITGENEAYSYAEINSSEMLNDGVGFDPGGDNEFYIHYTDAVKLMQYPFSYNDTYSDTYYTSYTAAEGLETHEHGTITVTADAWGSVTTPLGTYNNTLRVKSVRNYTDSVWMSGMFLYANTYTETDYDWYTTTSHTPVITVSQTGDGSSVSYRTDAVGISNNAIFTQISLYPNPASNTIHVRLPESRNENTQIDIISLTGQVLLQLEKSESHQYSADISGLTPGVYLLTVKNNWGAVTTSKFVKK
jgi:hypothetical protein